MKISLWQQFSSNHSACFTVIGRFGTAEKAQAAAVEFQQFIENIAGKLTVFRQLQEAMGQENDTTQASPLMEHREAIEHAILEFFNTYDAQRTKFETWGDWVEGDYPTSELVKIVQFDVFVMSNSWDVVWSPVPIATVMAKLGALGVTSELDDTRGGGLSLTNVQLSFDAVDEVHAEHIAAIIRRILEWGKAENRAYFTGEAHPAIPEMPWISLPIKNAWDNIDYQITGGYLASLHCDQRHVSCYLQFHRVGFGLPAMISWLESLGCTNIEYKLSEGPEIPWGEQP